MFETLGKIGSSLWEAGAKLFDKAKEGGKQTSDFLAQRPLVRATRNLLSKPLNFGYGMAGQTRTVLDKIFIKSSESLIKGTAGCVKGLGVDVPVSVFTGPGTAGYMALSPLGRLIRGGWRTLKHIGRIFTLAGTLQPAQAAEQLITTPRAAIKHLIQDPLPDPKNAPELVKQAFKPVTKFVEADWKFATGIGGALQSVGQGLAGILDIPSAGWSEMKAGNNQEKPKETATEKKGSSEADKKKNDQKKGKEQAESTAASKEEEEK